jgi:hypothetical protein
MVSDRHIDLDSDAVVGADLGDRRGRADRLASALAQMGRDLLEARRPIVLLGCENAELRGREERS